MRKVIPGNFMIYGLSLNWRSDMLFPAIIFSQLVILPNPNVRNYLQRRKRQKGSPPFKFHRIGVKDKGKSLMQSGNFFFTSECCKLFCIFSAEMFLPSPFLFFPSLLCYSFPPFLPPSVSISNATSLLRFLV